MVATVPRTQPPHYRSRWRCWASVGRATSWGSMMPRSVPVAQSFAGDRVRADIRPPADQAIAPATAAPVDGLKALKPVLIGRHRIHLHIAPAIAQATPG